MTSTAAGVPAPRLGEYVHDFVLALRERGLLIGPSELITAEQAVLALNIADRTELRAGLAAVLLRDHLHRPTFDMVFDLWFPVSYGDLALAHAARRGSADLETDPAAQPAGADPAQQDPDGRDRADAPQNTEREALRQAMRAEAIRALIAGGDHDGVVAQIVAQLGGYASANGTTYSSYQALRELNPQTLIAAIAAGLLAAAGDEDAEEGSFAYESARRLARDRVAGLTQRVREVAELRKAERLGARAVVKHAAPQLPEDIDFFAATRADFRRMESTVRPLARLLATRLKVRRQAQHRGAIDLRRTLRRSMSTGGVPIDLVRRPPRPKKPELVLLCDLSGSVAGFSSFTVMLTQALTAEFSKLRIFGFVDGVDDITDYFDPTANLSYGEVISLAEKVIKETEVARFGGSDYGGMLTQFVEKFPDALDHRATLLILGDARSNHIDPRIEVLSQVVDTARHAFWLNPERRSLWGTGDSVADKYAREIDMFECRNAKQLADVVAQVLPI